jgi:hypothetical protein
MIGVEAGFMQRERTITPATLVPSLISTLGAEKVETLADLTRAFVGFAGVDVSYKAYHDRLSLKGFPIMMQRVFERLCAQLIMQSLRFMPQSPFSRFKAISIQDGTSYALHDGLKERFPGRFNTVKPAAIELHATLDLLTETLTKVSLAPDTESERAFLPEPASLAGTLLLADRGYPSFAYLKAVEEVGGSFVMRAKGNLASWVLGAYVDGQLVELEEAVPLPDYIKRHDADLLDLLIEPRCGSGFHVLRMIVIKTTKGRIYLLTNLPADEFSAEMVGLAYRLRWQVELMFKEWKSYANLHAFVTRDPHIAEGLIWASLCAAVLKRFLAQAAQHVGHVAISTRKAAMMLGNRLSELLQQVCLGADHPGTSFKETINYLIRNAKRSHPKRERRIGRQQLGLRPCFGG